MIKEVKLPQLGQSMEEGAILECLVEIGQHVKKGDYLFEIETDKVTLELESPEEGYVKAIVAKKGQTILVDQVLLLLGDENDEINTDAVVSQNQKSRITASAVIKTSNGEITQTDLNAAAKDQGKYKLGQKVHLAKLAKITAEKMAQSKSQIPCFYLNISVDAAGLIEYQEKLKKKNKVEITIDDFLIRVLSIGFEHWPIMTGQIAGDEIFLADSIGVGLAVITSAGMIGAVVKDVGKKNITEIAEYRTALLERTNTGKLALEDLEGACITIGNLSSLGIDSFTPIVVPGQCSILGVGKITDTCVPGDGGVIAGKSMKMTLAVDHRIANGAEAAQFLGLVGKLLEEPEKLI
ncbi:MAG: 2-oxo acid dehydrogenase subunit E2 [Sedimentisphaerales bacterium]|nr:2-oxo acid dehydrogenase subunit E2 [Sedimentisphaerales bacterium]